jgi:hypothetical protein
MTERKQLAVIAASVRETARRLRGALPKRAMR